MQGPLAHAARILDARSVRASSYDRKGGNDDWTTLAPGEAAVLADFEGPGRIVHIWTTHWSPEDPCSKRNLVLRMTWDDAPGPQVLSPVGDFFGQGWGLDYNFASLPLAAAPRSGKSLVCYFPMPFRTRARIEVVNESAVPCDRFYYYVDAELGPLAPDEGYFHAWYNQESTGTDSPDGLENAWVEDRPDPANPSDGDNYLWCAAEGRGHFAGVNYYVQAPSTPWPGEGDDMFLLDGEPWPGLHGTGTEDYFNTAWGPDEHYLHPSFGIAYAPGRNNDDPRFGWIGRMHYYRFHLSDPVRFARSIRASIEHGHANGMRLELASVAYWYLGEPRPVPPIADAASRAPKPLTSPEDIHRWRHAWLKSLGQ